MIINQISTFMANKPCELLKILDILTDEKINIRALNVAETSEYGILRIIVDNDDVASKALKDKGYIVSINKVFVIPVLDEPSGAKKLLEKLAKDDINIEYMYSACISEKGFAYMVIVVRDIDKMINCIEKNNIKTATL